MGPMIKFTDNLMLKVENEEKARAVLNLYLRNKECFEEFEPTRPSDFYTEEYHRTSLRREYKAYSLGTFLRYYIYLFPNENNIIGAINFNFYNDSNVPYAEVGYKVDYKYQNMGIAYSACLAGFRVMKDDYGITKIYARIHPDNTPSRHLAEKLGFIPVSYEPKSANVNGRYVDLIRYSLDTSEIQ